VNAKQAAFVREYLIDRNATQAAIRAGYSEKTAYSHGQRLLKHVEVSAAIEDGAKEHAERCAVTVDSLTKELNDALKVAETKENAAAMVSAIMAKAELHGLKVQRREDVTKQPSLEDEIKRANELADRLGLPRIPAGVGGAPSIAGAGKPH